jgi:hypothetical protein
MKNGTEKPRKVYGYRVTDDKMRLEIVPEEAEIVRLIFDLSLSGKGARVIAKELNSRGIPSPTGKRWTAAVIWDLLRNPKMCGDLLHQRQYTVDHISKRVVQNRGELPMYRIENTHDAIISKEAFEEVQAGMNIRKKKDWLVKYHDLEFRKLIKCGICGKTYTYRKKYENYTVWLCARKVHTKCESPIIPVYALEEAATTILGLETYDKEAVIHGIDRIIAGADRRLTFILEDGEEIQIQWRGKRNAENYSDTR